MGPAQESPLRALPREVGHDGPKRRSRLVVDEHSGIVNRRRDCTLNQHSSICGGTYPIDCGSPGVSVIVELMLKVEWHIGRSCPHAVSLNSQRKKSSSELPLFGTQGRIQSLGRVDMVFFGCFDAEARYRSCRGCAPHRHTAIMIACL